MTRKRKIVIIGAGFGGIQIAKKLSNKNFEILILDRNNYHTFQPLLYQVASGGLEPDNIAYPIRRIFRKGKNIRFRMAKVKEILPKENKLKTDIGDVSYDDLIIATGSRTNYFGLDSVKGKLLSLKKVTDALDIRSWFIQNLEASALFKNEGKREEQLLNVAIVGGGPAGIELAGALAEMKKYVLPRDYPDIDFSKMTINLFETSPELLGVMSDKASKSAYKHLDKLGVKINLNTSAEKYDGEVLGLNNNVEFETKTVIWTAGVKGNIIDGLAEDQILKNSRYFVDEFNKINGTENIYAIGDIAACITDENPRGQPMLAPVAMQQGKTLAKNFIRREKNKEMKPFKYLNKGVMATIGRRKAVVDLGKYSFQGTFAWFVWMFVHLILLVGFRNKLVILIDWFQNYLKYDRPLGLIIRRYERK